MSSSSQKKKRRSAVADGRQFSGMPWEFSYDYKEDGCIAAADTLGDWYRAKIIDVINPQDEQRWSKVTENAIIAQRGLNGVKPVKVKRDIRFDRITNGNWLRIHFQGWGANSDEWILFQVKGFICLAGEEEEDGEAKPARRQCFCERHFDEAKYREYLNTLAPAAALGPQEELLQLRGKLSQQASTEGKVSGLLEAAATAAEETPEEPAAVAAEKPPPVPNEPQEGQTAQVLAQHQEVLLHQLLLEESQGFVLVGGGGGGKKPQETNNNKQQQQQVIDPALLLELNPHTGRPVLAERVLVQAEKDNVSIERLLRDFVGLNQNLLAGRRWLKGEKLTRPSVLLAASHIAEWYFAKQENRSAVPVSVDMQQIDAYLQLHPLPTQQQHATADRYKRAPTPPPVTLKRKALKPAAAAAVQQTKKKQPVEEEEEDVFEEEQEEPAAQEASAALPQQVATLNRFAEVVKFKLVHVQSSSEGGRAYVAGGITIGTAATRWYGVFPTQAVAEQAEKRAKVSVERCFAEIERACTCNAALCKECENDLFMCAVDSCGTFSSKPLVAATPLLPPSQTNYYNLPSSKLAALHNTLSTTQWRGNAFPTAPNRLAEQRTYFTRFAFRAQDVRSQYGDFAILDHVILSRRCMHDEEEGEEQNTPDYFVGQIEALWEEPASGGNGQVNRFVRVNWFFWPEEAEPQLESYAEVGNGEEVFTSSEVDQEPLHRVLAKTRVFSAAQFHAGKPEVFQVKLDWDAPASFPQLVSESVVVEETAAAVPQQPPPPAKRKHKGANAPTIKVEGIEMRACKRCGMSGFTSPSELSAHTARFCGADSVEALQRRRSEAGRPVLTGIHAPTEPTVVCERVQYPQPATAAAAAVFSPQLPLAIKRQKRAMSVVNAADEEELLKTEYVNPRIVHRALARANQGPFFAQHHFSQRKNQVTKIHEQDGNNELQSSLLFGTQDTFWSQNTATALPQSSCLQPLAAVAAPAVVVTTCTFCCKQLFPETEVRFCCEVCENVNLCLSCMRRGRQGAGHVLSHPYHIPLSTLDQTHPNGAQTLLQRKLPPGTIVEYSLLEITRLPLGRPRYRYGATIAGKTSLCADEFAYTEEDAKNECAITCLRVFFGAATVYSFPVLAYEWSAWEAAKLLDMLQQHGLAWETVAPLVGTKPATECREFFAQHFLHNVAAAAAPTVQISLVSREGREELPDLDFQPEPAALEDAKEFVQHVKEFYARRAAGRRNFWGIVNDSLYSVPPTVAGSIKPVCCCDKPADGGEHVVTCSACLELFHLGCLLEQDRDSQVRLGVERYCPSCVLDERYVYAHYCWGEAGRVVCSLGSAEDEQAVAMWHANADCIKQATAIVDAAAGKKVLPPVKSMYKGKRSSAAASAQQQQEEEQVDFTTDPFYITCKESIESLRLALAKVRKERDELLKYKV